MSTPTQPSQPPQPTHQQSLNQPTNPASKTTTESHTSMQPTSAQRTDTRLPSTHNAAPQPSSLGAGDTGPLKEKAIPSSDAQPYSDPATANLEGEQMRASGEGAVAAAVRSGGGGGHAEEAEIGADLQRKRGEHDEELRRRGERTREEIEREAKEDWTGARGGVDVEGAIAGRGVGVVVAPEG